MPGPSRSAIRGNIWGGNKQKHIALGKREEKSNYRLLHSTVHSYNDWVCEMFRNNRAQVILKIRRERKE